MGVCVCGCESVPVCVCVRGQREAVLLACSLLTHKRFWGQKALESALNIYDEKSTPHPAPAQEIVAWCCSLYYKPEDI